MKSLKKKDFSEFMLSLSKEQLEQISKAARLSVSGPINIRSVMTPDEHIALHTTIVLEVLSLYHEWLHQ